MGLALSRAGPCRPAVVRQHGRRTEVTMAKLTEFVDYEYRNGNLAVQWEFIGEGLNGDYNPDDPKDVPLLRANLVYYHPTNTNPKGEDAFTCEDGSYCTLADTETPREKLDEASRLLIERVRSHGDLTFDEEWGGATFNDHIMQAWTWVEYDGDKIVAPKGVPYWR